MQRTPYRTHAYAHFSLAHLTRDDCTCGSRLSVLRVSQNHSISHHVSLETPISSVPSDFLFTNLFSDAIFRFIHTTDWNQKKPLCQSAVRWNVWPSGQSDPRYMANSCGEHFHFWRTLLAKPRPLGETIPSRRNLPHLLAKPISSLLANPTPPSWRTPPPRLLALANLPSSPPPPWRSPHPPPPFWRNPHHPLPLANDHPSPSGEPPPSPFGQLHHPLANLSTLPPSGEPLTPPSGELLNSTTLWRTPQDSRLSSVLFHSRNERL